MFAVDAEELERVYDAKGKAVHALRGVDLRVKVGTVQGLLGPNGAGKTTLTKILSTALLPTKGRASILGFDVARQTDEVRRRIGVVLGGDRGLYPRLSARHNLEYWAALYNVPPQVARRRIDELLDRVGLTAKAEGLAETFSRGMKQRLHLARGLIADAEVLLLDEPTMGMDPLAARDFRQLIKELRSAGKSILLTTHDMEEAEAVCDSVALIDHGKVLAIETPEGLAKLVAKIERVDFATPDESVAPRVSALAGIVRVIKTEEVLGYRVELEDEKVLPNVVSYLLSQGVTQVRTSRPSLTEVYVQLIGDRGLMV